MGRKGLVFVYLRGCICGGCCGVGDSEQWVMPRSLRGHVVRVGGFEAIHGS